LPFSKFSASLPPFNRFALREMGALFSINVASFCRLFSKLLTTRVVRDLPSDFCIDTCCFYGGSWPRFGE
jgi:hypothetical protein